jgi:hypothetical protein
MSVDILIKKPSALRLVNNKSGPDWLSGPEPIPMDGIR